MSTATTPDRKSAPIEAFRFEADGVCKFADPTERKDGLRRMQVDVLARTGEPVWHWYWEWIVHDFAGMRSKPKVAFDYRHDADEPIGYGTPEVREGELWIPGELISRLETDEAAKIMDLGPAGVPYENSIHFDPRYAVLEFIPEGFTAEVNGQQVVGPVTVMREWDLLRCAFCLTGVDGGSGTSFQSEPNESAAMFSLKWTQPMTKAATDTATNTATDTGKESTAGKQSTETPTTETPNTPAVDPGKLENDFRASLAKFTDKFGAEDGLAYFNDKLSMEQALEKHNAKLEQQVKDANKGQSDAEAKLAKLDLGEETGVDTGGGKTSQKSKFEDLFKPA
jgi:hypothetical protein